MVSERELQFSDSYREEMLEKILFANGDNVVSGVNGRYR